MGTGAAAVKRLVRKIAMPAVTPDEIRERVSEALRDAFAATADFRYWMAAGIVNGRRAGRRVIDDSAALAAMGELIASARAHTIQQAARFAARAMPGGQSEEFTGAPGCWQSISASTDLLHFHSIRSGRVDA